MNRTSSDTHASATHRTASKAPQLSLLTSTSSAASGEGLSHSPLDSLDECELAEAQRHYPRIVNTLIELDDMLRYQEARYDAKDAELTRCIRVGEELIDQLDQLKERCRVLSRERDELHAALAEAEATGAPHERHHRERQQQDEAMTDGLGLAGQAALEREAHAHQAALRQQDAWWQARLEESKQAQAQAQTDARAREDALKQQHTRLAEELTRLRQHQHDMEQRATTAAQGEATAQEALRAQQETCASLQHNLVRLGQTSTRDVEKRERDHARLAQELATLQTTLQRVQTDPEAHVPVTSVLLGLTTTGRAVRQQLHTLLEHMVEREEEAHDQHRDVYPIDGSPVECRKVLAKAAALLAKETPPPPSPQQTSSSASPWTAEASAPLSLIPWSASSTAPSSSSSPMSTQGVYHAWMSHALTDMVALMDSLSAVWRLQTGRDARVQHLLTDKCAREHGAAQIARAALEKAEKTIHAERLAWREEKTALDAALEAAVARHVHELDEQATMHIAQEEEMRATLHAAHVQEKRQIQRVAETQMQSILQEAQLEVERLQRANARLQAQLSLAPTTGTATTSSSAASPVLSGPTSSTSTVLSPVLTGTVKHHAAAITALEAERTELQRRLREESAARQALHEELKLALSRAAKPSASAQRVTGKETTPAMTALVAVHADGAEEAVAAPWHRLEQENRNLRARLVTVVREAQDELDGLQATNTSLTRDLARTRAELEGLRQEVIPELESAAAAWQHHRQTAQEERRRLEAQMEAKDIALLSAETRLAELEAALAAAQQVRGELESMGHDLKEALGRAALDVQQQCAREQELSDQVRQWQEAHAALTETCAALTAEKATRTEAEETHAQQQDEAVARLTSALQQAEAALAAQHDHVASLEALAKESAARQVAANEQGRVTAHTLEAVQARATVAESALEDAQAELARQRRLTERARDDLRRLGESHAREVERHVAALQACEVECAAQKKATAAAQAEVQQLAEERTRLDALCAQLRARTEQDQAAAQTSLHAQLTESAQTHKATLQLRDDQLQALRTRLDVAERDVSRSTQRLEDREAALAEAHAQLSAHLARETALEARLSELEAGLCAAQKAEAAAQAALVAERAASAQQAANMVDKTTHEATLATLAQRDADAAALATVQQRAERQAQRLASLDSDLAQTRARLEASEAQSEALQEALQALRQEQLAAQSAHAQALRDLRARLSEAEAALDEARDGEQAHAHRAAETHAALLAAQAQAETKIEDLQRALVAREADGHIALDRVQQEARAHLALAAEEAETAVEAARREVSRLTSQHTALAQQREALSATAAQQAQALAVSEAETQRLQARVVALREELNLVTTSHVAERKELDALRRVNRALEGRLSDVESDREPLRQRLRHLLDASSTSVAPSVSTSMMTDGSGA